MQIHQVKSSKKAKKKIVGRGGKRGTYSGRGVKGQKARAGRKLEPPIRGIIKKYHKLRGYNFNSKDKGIAIVNLKDINDNFKENEVVSPETLLEKKMIRRASGKKPEVKILGKGEINKSLKIKDCLLSEAAKNKIEKAKGSIL